MNTYFASLPSEDLLIELTKKVRDYYGFISSFGILDKWRRSYLQYYGTAESGATTSNLSQGGQNGENYILKINHYRSLLQSLLTMTTSQRPALQPKANNTDYKSFSQTVLARAVLDYYLTEKQVEKHLRSAVEFALIAGEGFINLTWNATAGNIYSVAENGSPVYDGDLECKVFHPIDVIRECNRSASQWYITREFKNRWDLAAKFTELADEILAVSNDSEFLTKNSISSYGRSTDDDYVPVYSFYHQESEACPNGRQVEFVGDICLTDGPLAYKNIPVFRIAPGDWQGTAFGYTVAYDLLGIQKNVDSLQSIVASNQLNFGQQNILVPRGAGIEVTALAQGLNSIEYNVGQGKPEPLNLVQTPVEIFNQISGLVREMETISGVNSVARGNPEASLKSGAALALVAAQAIQFNSGLAQSYERLLEDTGTGIIEVLQQYATTPRIATIAGKSNRSRLQEFKGSDLEGINRVSCESVNPVSKTAAGRLQMAQDLLHTNLITTPQHYFEVVATGSLDALFEHETSQIMLIRSENEDLADGKQPPVTVLDAHVLHIKEHSTCLDSPEARANPTIVQNVTAHIQAHIDQLKNADPQLLQLLGQQPIGPSQQPQGQAPTPPGNMSANLNPTPPIVNQASGVKGPRMPTLPHGSPEQSQEAYQTLKAQT